MSTESRRWAPSRWPCGRVQRTRRRVLRYSYFALSDLVGPYNAACMYAELTSSLASDVSAAALKARSITTIGDTTPPTSHDHE